MAFYGYRLRRNYRNFTPTKFYEFNRGVRTSLTDKSRFADSIWAGNSSLLPSYFEVSDKHHVVFHEAKWGSKLMIAERNLLQEQLVLYLDEIASLLEMAAVRTPDIILASGFHLNKERRGHPRAKGTAAARNVAQAGEQEGESGTPA